MGIKSDIVRLAPVLEKLEIRTEKETYVHSIVGGYAEANMFDYDDDNFYVELNWGVQDMGGGHSYNYTEQITVNRKTMEY